MENRKNILIVEDDLLNQKIYITILSKHYLLKICNDDDEFYAALKEKDYDIFIIDLALNCGKSGIDLIFELREIIKYKNTPIFVISAFASRKDQMIALAAGATKFIIKPFDGKYLLSEIIKLEPTF